MKHIKIRLLAIIIGLCTTMSAMAFEFDTWTATAGGMAGYLLAGPALVPIAVGTVVGGVIGNAQKNNIPLYPVAKAAPTPALQQTYQEPPTAQDRCSVTTRRIAPNGVIMFNTTEEPCIRSR